jgi:hypothetical protein
MGINTSNDWLNTTLGPALMHRGGALFRYQQHEKKAERAALAVLRHSRKQNSLKSRRLVTRCGPDREKNS